MELNFESSTNNTKAELLQVGIFFHIHLFAREILLIKKLEIEETKITQYSTFKTGAHLFSVSNFFINKISRSKKWIRF